LLFGTVSKFAPDIVTIVPIGPDAGVKDVMVGIPPYPVREACPFEVIPGVGDKVVIVV
jgi:hypothetical protein